MNDKLLQAALAASKDAYAPYSNFQVGAAVLLDNDQIITGCNIENSSYGLSMCAERVAIYNALSKYPIAKIKKLAIASNSTNQLITPCGACRQVIIEFAQKQAHDIEIVMISDDTAIVKHISELLPNAFQLDK